MSFLSRAKKANDQPGDPRALDPAFLSVFPALHEYLTATSYPDGQPRRTASLTMFAEEGLWKACLSDRDTEQSLFVSSNVWGALIEELELLLQEEDPPFRKNRGAKGNATQKGKKGG